MLCGLIVDAVILIAVIKFFSGETLDFLNAIYMGLPAAIVGALASFGLQSAVAGSGMTGPLPILLVIGGAGIAQVVVLAAMMVWFMQNDFRASLIMAGTFFVAKVVLFVAIAFAFARPGA